MFWEENSCLLSTVLGQDLEGHISRATIVQLYTGIWQGLKEHYRNESNSQEVISGE